MKPRVLFLCTGNSCRSQMAEGLLRTLAGDQFQVDSAGTYPVGVHPGAVAAMREVGIDITGQTSKSLGEFLNQRIDYVITVCDRAKESCPTLPGATTLLHWSLDDPAATLGSDEERRAVFRHVRDEIANRVRQFVEAAR